MFLHRIHLDPRCREVRRDISDPYQLHSTLCRAFSEPDRKCPPREFLWRIEPETGANRCPRVLVQSCSHPDWDRIGVKGWLAQADPAVELTARLSLDTLQVGQRFRFRLRANPTVNRGGKRLGLQGSRDQEQWLARKGEQHGFALPRLASFDLSNQSNDRIDVRISQEQMLIGRQHRDNEILVFSVLYDGIITITRPDEFRKALQSGIGHAKAMGLGLLSVAPTI